VFYQGLPQPISDNTLTVHARMSANIQLLVQLICPSCGSSGRSAKTRMSKSLWFFR